MFKRFLVRSLITIGIFLLGVLLDRFTGIGGLIILLGFASGIWTIWGVMFK